MKNTRQRRKRRPVRGFRARGGGMCVPVFYALSLIAGLLFPLGAHAGETSTPPIRSACEIDYPPFCIVHEDGTADGFSVELMRAALAKMGREVAFRTGPWAEVRGWLERGEVEALPLVGRTPERERLFDFTVPYMTMYGAIVVRKETEDVRNLVDLRGRRVGVMKGDNAEEFLRREDRDFEIVTTPTFSDAFHALADGLCDAVVMQRLVAVRLLQETGLADLKIVDRPVREFAQDFCFAVKEGDREMLSVLNEGLALAVADGTHRRLHAKWFASLELPSDRPIVVGGDHNYPPFEFLDKKGRPAGFTVDLTRAIAREMNMDVRIQLGRWEDMVHALQDGKIDALEGMFYSPERDRVLDFSPSYLVIHCVSVVRRGEGQPPVRIQDLAGRDLVVQAEDAILDAITDRGIEARITTVETQEDVVRAVAEGRNACGLATRFGALYAIKKNGWTNIDIGDRAFYSGRYSFAVPPGHEALLAEFTEGLRILKDSGEYQSIYEKWLGVYEPGMSSRTIFKYIAIVAVPLVLIAILALLWSWSLRRQVSARTRELRESEQFTRAVLNNLPVGIAVNSVDPTVAFSYMNDSFPRTYRTTRAALASGDSFWEAVYEDPAFRAEIKKRVLEDCASGDPGSMSWEDVPITREGQETSFVSARNIPLPEKNLTISLAWDVTERKRREEKIRHLTEVLRAVRNVNQLITHEKDRDTLLRRACEILTETRGYRTAWIGLRLPDGSLRAAGESGIGEGFQALQAQLERGELPECWKKAMGCADPVVTHDTIVDCVRCPLAKTYRDTAALSSLLHHADRDYGFLVVALPADAADDDQEQSLFRELAGDISYALFSIEADWKHKQAEKELKKHRDHLEELIKERTAELNDLNRFSSAILDTAPVGIVTYRADGSCASANESAGPLIGATREQVLRQNFRTLASWRESGLLAVADRCLETGEPQQAFSSTRTSYGRDVVLDTRFTSFTVRGEPHLLLTFNDITDRVRAEEALKHYSAQLEAANKELEAFAYSVSHDLRAPLRAVDGFSEALLEDYADTLDEQGKEHLHRIRAGAQRMAQLIDDLLKLSRITRREMEHRQVDLSALARKAVASLRQAQPGRDVDVVIEEGLTAYGDMQLLSIVIENLLGNAWKFSGTAANARIEVGRLPIGEGEAGDARDVAGQSQIGNRKSEIVYFVRDNGAGFDTAYKDKLFGAFQRLHSAAEFEGTGIGLATVQRAILRHGGRVWAEGEVGKGATFYFTLK